MGFSVGIFFATGGIAAVVGLSAAVSNVLMNKIRSPKINFFINFPSTLQPPQRPQNRRSLGTPGFHPNDRKTGARWGPRASTPTTAKPALVGDPGLSVSPGFRAAADYSSRGQLSVASNAGS